MNLDQDTRLELISVASSSVRRNRPVWLIVVGFVILACAIGYALYCFALIGRAASSLSKAQRNYEAIETAVLNLEKFQQSDAANTERFRPDPRALAKLESVARDLNLTVIIAEETDKTLVRNKAKKRLTATATNQPGEQLIAFMQRASIDIPGLELASLSWTPGPTLTAEGRSTWTARMVFTRWEDQPTTGR